MRTPARGLPIFALALVGGLHGCSPYTVGEDIDLASTSSVEENVSEEGSNDSIEFPYGSEDSEEDVINEIFSPVAESEVAVSPPSETVIEDASDIGSTKSPPSVTPTPTPITVATVIDPVEFVWTDSIQSLETQWGFDSVSVQHPIDTDVEPNDTNGANFSRVTDPLGGDGYALRMFGTFSDGGSRSQAGLFDNQKFQEQATSGDGLWIAQEWYFPESLSAGGDTSPWLSLMDFHSIDSDNGNRWDTSPGLLLHGDGSMRARWEWGELAAVGNDTSDYTTLPFPVGVWFDVEVHYEWTDIGSVLSLWIDGELALEHEAGPTRADSHKVVEYYVKWHGSDQGQTAWGPTPSLRYVRNIRIAGERIWQ